MKYLKYIIVLAIVAIIGAAAWRFTHFTPLERKSATSILSSLQNTRGIERLYTGIYHMPIMDLRNGYLKRDIVTEGVKLYFNPFRQVEAIRRLIRDEPFFQGDEAKIVVTGCCSKKYEVAFGYDNLLKLLQDETLIQEVCAGNTASLPEPEILAVNCKSTAVYGKYDSSGNCYTWDSDEALRKRIIRQALKDDDVLPAINGRGREALKNFVGAFCK